jgi:uncharacterized membrane-anchored protein YitT (DUF2179 family)
MKNKRKIVGQYLIITLGASFVALGLDLFLVPNKFVAGGVSGIATIIFHIFNFPVGISMLVLNAILFIIAFRILGRTFGAKTIYCTIILSVFTDIFAIFLPSHGLTQNLILAVLFGAFLCGAGMGLVFSAGASTGGTDIIAIILKKLLHLAPAWGLLVVDIVITLIAGYFFGKEVAMFSILAVIVNTFTINTVLEGVTSSIQVMIISEKYSEITDRILEELGVGATLLRGEGAFEEIPTYIILTVLHSRRQFVRLKQIVSEEDEKAFLLVSHVKEVLGEGFKGLKEV